MLAIQDSLAGSYIPGIVAPGRRFVKEGKLMKVYVVLQTMRQLLCVQCACRCAEENPSLEWYFCSPTCSFIQDHTSWTSEQTPPGEKAYRLSFFLYLTLSPSCSYESRGVVALLTSEVQLLISDPRAPGVSALFRVMIIILVCAHLHDKTSFLLLSQVTDEESSLTFFSNSEEEVYEWAQIIENTIR